MARAALLAAIATAAGPAWPQGQIIFDNRVPNVVVAPVFGTDPRDPAVVWRGNTALGVPAGDQVYGGNPLAGTEFCAQLFAGPPHAATANLQPLHPAVPFRTGIGAGFVLAPDRTLRVPGVAGGKLGKAQLRAWNTRNGVVTNWWQATATAGNPQGSSWPFVTPPLGGAYQAPPNLAGLQSFSLGTGKAQGLALKIKFQPDGVMPPPGFVEDTGSLFGQRANGMWYGWNFDHKPFARARGATNSPDASHDSFIEMQHAPASVWEIAVSNGLYGVHVTAGDPVGSNAVYRIEAEGRLVVQGTPTGADPWTEGDVLVAVEDGRLTIAGSAGACNNRLCFVEIAAIEAPALRLDFEAPAGQTPTWIPRFSGEPGFKYLLESSADLSSWSPIGLAQFRNGCSFEYRDPTNTQARFYRARTLATPGMSTFYANSFNASPGSEWSHWDRGTTPSGGRWFLGPFGHATVTLSLSNLPPHTRAGVCLEVFIMGSWEGSSTNQGPDTWELKVNPGRSLLRTSFLAAQGDPALVQSYPGSYPGGGFPGGTGASETNSLGYAGGDGVYVLNYEFEHTEGVLSVQFVGLTSEGVANESWGIARVLVSMADDPYDR